MEGKAMEGIRNRRLRVASLAIGALFIITGIAAIAGGALLTGAAPVRGETGVPPAAVAGVLLWFVNDLGIVFIAVLAFPFLRRRSESLALGYVGIRVVECMVLVVGALCSLLVAGGWARAGAEAPLLTQAAELCYTPLTLIFLGAGGVVFTVLLLRSRMLPAWLATFGAVAYALLPPTAALSLLGIVDSARPGAGMLPMLPVIAFEFIALPLWLFVKGFAPPREAAVDAEVVEARLDGGQVQPA
jgi:hypothetical protein